MKPDSLKETTPKYPMPFVRLELVVFAVSRGTLQVLLSHRKEAPFKGKWGLPGGVLRIDFDSSLEHGAQRVAMERLNRNLPNIEQVVAVGGTKRDPRAPWAMSVVYRSLVQPNLEATPGKRVQALEWRDVADVVASDDLAFDHANLVRTAVEAVRQDVRELRFPTGWLPEEFTLTELQIISQDVLGVKLDKVTFRRRLDVDGRVVALDGRTRLGTAFRPPQLYKLA